MKTIDSFLHDIVFNRNLVRKSMPVRDLRVVISLSRQLNSGMFLTKRQADLLLRILTENSSSISSIIPDITDALATPTWSTEFREIEIYRKIYILKDNSNYFAVDFSFNPEFKKKLLNLSPKILEKKFVFELTVSNVTRVMKEFVNDKFEIDPEITRYYEEICSIAATAKNPFDVENITSEKFKSILKKNLGENYLSDLRKLHDNKIKFQYVVNAPLLGNTLADKIARRTSQRVFLDSGAVHFDELLSSLKDLERFPVLLIFNGQSSVDDLKYVNMLNSALSNLELTGDVGIYFRYDKNLNLSDFNQTVTLLEYNKILSANTMIAGLKSNQLPKFVVEAQWKPKSIISLTPNFKSNKNYTYFSDVDLIVYYGNHQPLDKEVNVLV